MRDSLGAHQGRLTQFVEDDAFAVTQQNVENAEAFVENYKLADHIQDSDINMLARFDAISRLVVNNIIYNML